MDRLDDIGCEMCNSKYISKVNIRSLYNSINNDKLSYTIIRAARLMDTPFLGSSGIEINQGGSNGEISRKDVAYIMYHASKSKKNNI